MKTVLAIDGGGIRGIIPAVALREIEKQVGKPVSECFDLICGVSTGGIIAASLTVPDGEGGSKFTPQDVIDFYFKEGKKIFKKRSRIPFYQLFKSKYKHAPLAKAIHDQIGDLQFSKLNNNVMIPCYDIVDRRPYFFKSWRPSVINVATHEVCVATASAPTYFNPMVLDMGNGSQKKILIDGSVAVNNPAMCALAEARRLWGKDEEIFVVSLGSGDVTDPIPYKKKQRWGAINWYPDVIEILVDAPTNTVDYQLRTLIPDSYVRIQRKIDLAEEKIDDVSNKNLRQLLTEAETMIHSNPFKVDIAVGAIEKRLREKQQQ